jgi:class 3 adenylate cyclase
MRRLPYLLLPLAGFLVLLANPRWDLIWEHHPSHFWLVMGAAAITAVLSYTTGDAARRRGDARVFLVSIAFLAASGFLFLHALATPKVLLDRPNGGFLIATPVGLTICSLFFAASAGRITPKRATSIVQSMSFVRLALIAVLLAWAAVSLTKLGPLDESTGVQRGSAPLIALSIVAVACFLVAGVRYGRLSSRRPSGLIASIVAADVLLAEAMLAVAFSRSWHATWWEWHVLMLAAFAIVAAAARAQWREEPFSDLYLDGAEHATRRVSVLFADLEGYTSFSERRRPHEVSDALNAIYAVAVPVVRDQKGEVNQIIGDAIMATFNTRGDQPDHAERALRTAIALRDEAARHPDWPRLRIGVNTGEAIVGVIGAAGGRTFTVLGDAVNVASRLEAGAPAGGIVAGAETIAEARNVRATHLGPLQVKGKAQPVAAYLVEGVT